MSQKEGIEPESEPGFSLLGNALYEAGKLLGVALWLNDYGPRRARDSLVTLLRAYGRRDERECHHVEAKNWFALADALEGAPLVIPLEQPAVR